MRRDEALAALFVYVLPLLLVSAGLAAVGLGGLALALLGVEAVVVTATVIAKRPGPQARSAPSRRPWLVPLAIVSVLGAVAGVATGGVLAGSAIALCLAGYDQPGLAGVLMERPAIVSVPAAFLVMVDVSVATSKGCPASADQLLLRLHAPERLGLSRGVERPNRGPGA